LLFVDIALYSQDNTQENESLSYISPCEFFDIGDILRNNKTKPAKRIKKETEDKYEVIRTSTIAKYQSINQSTISSEANRTDDSNNIDTKNVSNNSFKDEIGQVIKSLRPISIDKKGNGDSKSEKTEKKEDVEQLTKGKSEEEAEMKRCLPSISKKTDPSVTKRTQPSDSKIVPVDVSDDCHKIGSVNVGRTSPLPVKPVEPVTRKSGEADVAVDVKSLNMEDVSDWMKKLKLEKYADIFHEKQVDGYLLMQLDKQMLKTDFGMGDFDIMKLTAFAKSGHVPKSRGGDL
jgi:seryl-tRNA synthetase